MSVSLSEAVRRGGNVATPKPMASSRVVKASSKPRAPSSLLKPGPKRKKIMLYPKTAEERAATAAHWARWAQREPHVLALIRQRKVAAQAAVTMQ